jgi:hypothetical protein
VNTSLCTSSSYVLISFYKSKLKIYNIIFLPSVTRMRWAGHVALMGEKRNVCSLFVGKSEGKRPLGRQRIRWIDNIKIDL